MHRETHQDKRPDKKRTGKSKTPSKQPRTDGGENKVEGEGSYEAGRRYDEHAREFVREGGVEPAADEARRDLDDDPQGMRRAEDEAKRGPK